MDQRLGVPEAGALPRGRPVPLERVSGARNAGRVGIERISPRRGGAHNGPEHRNRNEPPVPGLHRSACEARDVPSSLALSIGAATQLLASA